MGKGSPKPEPTGEISTDLVEPGAGSRIASGIRRLLSGRGTAVDPEDLGDEDAQRAPGLRWSA